MPSESGFGASDGILLGFFRGVCDGYCATSVGGIDAWAVEVDAEMARY
ncbi:TPA: hypothetical protein WL679_000789 [Neisseria gonorrhoeae]